MNDTIFYVYKLIDPRNNKTFYVGKGKEDRKYYHIKNVKRNNAPNGNDYLYNKIKSILKDGYEDVKYETVKRFCDEDQAYKKEKQLIKKIGIENLCNIGTGGCGGDKMSNHPDKERIYAEKDFEAWNKGKTYEECFGEEKAKRMKKQISERNKGHDPNEGSFKSGENHRYYGKNRPEVGEKISSTLEEQGVYDKLRKRMRSGDHPLVQNNMKCVIGWSTDGEILGTWESAKNCSKDLDIPYHWVHKGCRDKITSEYTGYIFEYNE